MPMHSWAQEDQTIDEILNGFDNHETSDDDLQDVLDGFDDKAEDKWETDGIEEDEILKGFEDETEALDTETAEKQYLPDFLSLDGYLKLGASYNLHGHKAAGTDTDYHGLSRLRTELQIELDAKFSESWQARVTANGFHDFAYTIRGRNDYTDDVLDEYEDELEFGEVWLLGSLTDYLDIKAGRQIVVWGKSDNIRITDVLNPLDLREPGLTDIENLRLPVTMTKLDYFFKDLNLSAIAIHEIRYNKNPEFGNDFFPFSQPLPSEETPDEGFDLDDTEFAIALNGIFRGWDASFYWANIYDDTPHLAADSTMAVSTFIRDHARLNMAGAAFNCAWGNWLFFTEAAYFDGIEFYNNPGKDYYQIDALVGTEYSGFTDTTVSVEIADRHIINYDSNLKDEPDFVEEDTFISALRLTRTCWHDTLSLTLLAQTYGITGDDGAFQRLSAEYDYTDSIEITGGIVFYQSGDLKRFRDVGDNDQVFLEIKYHF
ncbi:MAG: hypothetical protein PVG87_15380 [Desulfobacteraceae bacterium]